MAGLSDLSIAMSSGLITGVVFIGVALMFKITAAPFHMWAPDVYEGAPTIVSTFFAVVPKIAILGFLLRFFVASFYDLADFWQQLVIFSSLSSMIIVPSEGTSSLVINFKNVDFPAPFAPINP